MRCLLVLFIQCCLLTCALGQAPANDNVNAAITLNNVTNYCSKDAEFTTVNATDGGTDIPDLWPSAGKDVWFKFTSINTDVEVIVTGLGTGTNTLTQPLIAFYKLQGNSLTGEIGAMTTVGHTTTAYKGGLSIGTVYYVRISAAQDAMGTFQLCLNNFSQPKKPGQDCGTASILCNKNKITETNVSGAGNNNQEATGTCLGTEANSAWYKFTAANNGTLTFTITPLTVTDDLDWVLYDLGINGDCSNVIAANAIRCASGSGVLCTPKYHVTGLSFSATDISEGFGCGTQDGMVKYVDLQEGHVYALLVDNFSSNNNGFTIEFGGTGEFVGPTAPISFAYADCPLGKTVTFNTAATNYTSIKWNFGEGASPATATTAGPHVVTYLTDGEKTVVLEVDGLKDCKLISSQAFTIFAPLTAPEITANKPLFCRNDTIKLSVPEIAGATYQWKGPAQYTATTASIEIPITGMQQAGNYSVTVTRGCAIDPVQTTVQIEAMPVAAFTTNPTFQAKFIDPITIHFMNLSKNASTYLWDFGDGRKSELTHPIIQFPAGKFEISLTAISVGGCVHTVSVGSLVVLPQGTLLIPNSFSPNGDGVNDYFNVNLSNLKRYTINIFNRWGARLFTGYNVFQSWDGTFNHQPLPVGTYYYQIIATDFDNKESSYSGSITLIR